MSETALDIDLGRIHHSKLNPRFNIDPEELRQLADSIRQVGILQPIILRPIGNGEYEVVVGEWRFAAAKELGFKTIRAIVREYSDEEVVN